MKPIFVRLYLDPATYAPKGEGAVYVNVAAIAAVTPLMQGRPTCVAAFLIDGNVLELDPKEHPDAPAVMKKINAELEHPNNANR